MGRIKKATSSERAKMLSNFDKHLDITVIEARQGFAITQMRVTNERLNRVLIAHGGAIFSLGDKAFAAAANYTSDVPCVAMQVNINYLCPGVKGSLLIAEATEVRRGRRTCVYEIKIFAQVRGKRKKQIAHMTETGFYVM